MCTFTLKLLSLWPEEEVAGPEKQDDGGGFGGSDWACHGGWIFRLVYTNTSLKIGPCT